MMKEDLAKYTRDALSAFVACELGHWQVYGFKFKQNKNGSHTVTRKDVQIRFNFDIDHMVLNTVVKVVDENDPLLFTDIACVYFHLGGRAGFLATYSNESVRNRRNVDETLQRFHEMLRFMESKLSSNFDLRPAILKFRCMTSPWEVHIGGWQSDVDHE
jgi:hypothetical protein